MKEASAQLLPLLLLLVLLYLLVLRPARKRARDAASLQSALSAGDEVMLTSGIYGTVVAVADDRASVSVAEGVVLTVHRGAVGQILRDEPSTAAATSATDDPAATGSGIQADSAEDSGTDATGTGASSTTRGDG